MKCSTKRSGPTISRIACSPALNSEAGIVSYRRLNAADREALLAFLRSLVLYSTEDLPTDLNGDGRVDARFRVAGQDTGRECFNPEWLFNTPCRIEGPVVAPDGRRIVSRAAMNLKAAYGVDLPWCRDRDRDGFPDVLGFKPGALSVER